MLKAILKDFLDRARRTNAEDMLIDEFVIEVTHAVLNEPLDMSLREKLTEARKQKGSK